MNTGGLRNDLPAGAVTYEELFRVIPFANRGYVMGPMPVAQLIRLLNRSIQTCGSYGALMQSGLNVVFSRNCVKSTDPDAKLIHVETVDGEVIMDAGELVSSERNRVFQVATLDFLASGGDGFDFTNMPLIKDLGIVREALSDALIRSPAHWTGKIDGRWKEIKTPSAGGDTGSAPSSDRD
jgi:2',3'-cyclic-nucleotide 2'-phosphodiesterase (5'-nucleotidase family)